MGACKPVHLGVRIDNRISQAIEAEAKRENTSKTAIVEKMACEYFGIDLPGMCKSCGKWNNVESKFCSECGNELIK